MPQLHTSAPNLQVILCSSLRSVPPSLCQHFQHRHSMNALRLCSSYTVSLSTTLNITTLSECYRRRWGLSGCNLCHSTDCQGWFGWSGLLSRCPSSLTTPCASLCQRGWSPRSESASCSLARPQTECYSNSTLIHDTRERQLSLQHMQYKGLNSVFPYFQVIYSTAVPFPGP